MNKNIIIVGIVTLIIGGGAGFFGGIQYQKSKISNQSQSAVNFQRGNGRSRFAGSGNPNGMAVRGTVIAKDNSSITVKLPDNSTKIVILSSSTTVGKSTQGTIDDVINGSNVMVFGTTNSDGTVTAQLVQVGGMMFGGPRPSGSPIPSAQPMGY